MGRGKGQWRAELFSPNYHRRQRVKGMLTPGMRVQLARSSDETCTYCKTRGTLLVGPDGKPWHFDHVMPISRGGALGMENVVLSCGPCNMSKGTMTVEEWRGTAS